MFTVILRSVLLAVVLLVPVSGQDLLLFSFENDSEMAAVVPRDAAARLTTSGVTHGQRALAIEFRRVAFPALFLRPSAPLDLREWAEIAYDITNPGTTPVRFSVRVDDDYRPDGVGTSRTGTAVLEPGATATFVFPLAIRDPLEFGMRGLPVAAGARNLGSNGTHILNLANIAQMQVFLASPAETVTLLLDNVRLRPTFALNGIIDRFGQFTGSNWPGKLTTDAEFPVRRAEEDPFLEAAGTFGGRSAYGGFAAGPRMDATGFFRTMKVDGRWWLVDPDGWLFFSTGFNAMNMTQTTFTTGREDMFTWLPAGDDPLRRHFGNATTRVGPIESGQTFNFHAANLHRKFGEDFAESWRAATIKRLNAWGFNTIGNWSDAALRGRGTPYVTTTSVWGGYNTVPNAGQGTAEVPDPFDPRFAEDLRARLRDSLTPAISDPYCIGHFVDNELNWGGTGTDLARYGVAIGALGQPVAFSPASRAMVALLQSRYSDISRLNAAWGTRYQSFDLIIAPGAVTAGMRADLAMLTTAFARQYYRTVREEVRRLDPNHLYLGSRMNNVNPDVIAAAAEETDVLSFNIYQRSVVPATWAFLGPLDKPAVIGEFHFGALDRGMFHAGLQPVASQAERAASFTSYMRSVADHPNFVGAHWFQLTDQAATGRPLDGENYNIGFVNVLDSPYSELVNAAREFHEEVYPRRLGVAMPASQKENF